MANEIVKKVKDDPNYLVEYTFEKLKQGFENLKPDTFDGILKKPYNRSLRFSFQENCLRSIERRKTQDLSDLKEHFSVLDNLRLQFDGDNTPAWRPITGTVCVEKYKMQSLTLFRNELKTMIAKQEVKIQNLTKNTKIRNEVIKQNNQMAEILSKLKENY